MATTSQLAPRQVAAPVAEGPVVLADHLKAVEIAAS